MVLSVRGTAFCCGLAELGNFNYTAKSFTHYHAGNNGGWQQVGADKPTTREEVIEKLVSSCQGYGGVIATTGKDQEYVDELLPSLGFVFFEFQNRAHFRTGVKIWFLDMNKFFSEVLPREKEKVKVGA